MLQLQSVDSTNNYAMAMVHEGMAQHGTAVLAAVQTRGKGQRNKDWQSAENQNLLCSIIIDPRPVPLANAFLVSMATAVAVHQAFNKYAGNETRIKWPNDLYWRDRKAGGILIENVVQGSEWKFAVIGIGLNMNQTAFGPLAQKAVSLKQITGKDWDLPSFARELFSEMEGALKRLQQNESAIIDDYHSHLYRKGEKIRLKQEGRVFDAVFRGVDRDGTLVVTTGMEERFAVGEVTWVI